MTREEKMKIVINNYFKTECSVNTSIREAFEKGFRIGASKVQKKPEVGTDCISRQAAIDAILHITNCKSVRELFEYNQLHHLTEMWSGGVNDAIDAVIGVDSAQLGTNLAEVGTDTISRQAAIDALKTDMASLDHIIKGMSANDVRLDAYVSQRNQVNCDIDTINNLPPAQPVPNYDEWCTDCKEYDHENSCCHRWTKVIRQTRRELQDEFVMTAVDGTLWVTVDDVQKVGRVIVDEDKSKFCRQFYMDAQPEQRTDLLKAEIKRMKRSFTTCINSDYYTGYMSALSAVEGYIAGMESERCEE